MAKLANCQTAKLTNCPTAKLENGKQATLLSWQSTKWSNYNTAKMPNVQLLKLQIDKLPKSQTAKLKHFVPLFISCCRDLQAVCDRNGGLLGYSWVSIPLAYTQLVELVIHIYFTFTLFGWQVTACTGEKLPSHYGSDASWWHHGLLLNTNIS